MNSARGYRTAWLGTAEAAPGNTYARPRSGWLGTAAAAPGDTYARPGTGLGDLAWAGEMAQPIYDLYWKYPIIGYGVLAGGLFGLYKGVTTPGWGRAGWLLGGALGTFLGGSFAVNHAKAARPGVRSGGAPPPGYLFSPEGAPPAEGTGVEYVLEGPMVGAGQGLR